jgi:hypothetical protein
VGGTCIISTQMGTHNRSVCSLFNDALSVIQTIEHRIMNWKGCVCGRKRPWPNFKVLFQQLRGEVEENHENLS